MLSSKLTSNMPEGTVFLLIDGNLSLLIGRVSLPEIENFTKKKSIRQHKAVPKNRIFQRFGCNNHFVLHGKICALSRKHEDVENAEAGFGFKSQFYVQGWKSRIIHGLRGEGTEINRNKGI